MFFTAGAFSVIVSRRTAPYLNRISPQINRPRTSGQESSQAIQDPVRPMILFKLISSSEINAIKLRLCSLEDQPSPEKSPFLMLQTDE